MMASRKKKTDEVTDLVSSVEAELAKLPEAWQDHPLAWASRQLAMDISICPPNQTHTAVRELRTTLAELRELAPQPKRGDGVDEIAERREARRRGAGLAG
jgi:hypothetical protein